MTQKKENSKIFVARQPIFDRDEKIYGYELLFRNGLENFFDESLNKDYASLKVLLDSFLLFDLKELTRGKKAFLNFTGRVLLSELALAFSTDSVVIELLETIEPTPGIIDVCKKLSGRGYVLALDDFEYDDKYRPLIELASIIKVDFLALRGEERCQIIESSTGMGKRRHKFLAERVETKDDVNEGLEMGYDYFQGYYYSKPVIVLGKDVPSYKVNLVQILKEMQEPEISITRLGKIIRRDVSISYKLLRFINSAAFGLVTDVRSIQHALNLLGIVEFKKWMSMVLLSQLGSDKPDELMINSLIRAKFCEMTAESLGEGKRINDFFLMGLFSLIDAFLDRKMEDVLAELPIPAEIKSALLEKEGKMGDVLQLITNYEQSKWDTVTTFAGKLDIDENEVLQHYFKSIKWANDFSDI
jgi:c-di-GMP-related signal transduction protein